jgi:hypothetical protein
MIELLRNSEFANKFRREIYPFKFNMRYIEAGKNSVIQLKYIFNSGISEQLVAIVECLCKNDKLLKLIIRSVEPEIVKLFIELYSIRDYSYVFVYNQYSDSSYYTDIVKANELGNYYLGMPKNTRSIKLLSDNVFYIYCEDDIIPKIHNYSIVQIPFNCNKYWIDKIDFLLGLVDLVIINNSMHFHDRVLKNIPHRDMWYNVALFLECLNRKSSTKSARKTVT